MNCIELFAGCGGAAIGLRRAGFTSLACVEADPHACATLEAAGLPAVRAWIGPGAPDGLATWCPPAWSVHLLWASPPCQPYSLAGARQGADDARDGWPATLATIKTMRPTWVIVENVVGAPVADWAQQVSALGYVVDYRTLDAVDWGLPSHRRRVFLVAGPHEYQWPTPTHYGPTTPFFYRIGRQPWVRFGEALGIAGTSGANSPAACVCATEDKGHTNPHLERGRATSVNRASDSLFLATGRRRLAPEESAILVGLGAHPIQGPKNARYRQAGNAVAPVMAEALGRNIPH